MLSPFAEASAVVPWLDGSHSLLNSTGKAHDYNIQ